MSVAHVDKHDGVRLFGGLGQTGVIQAVGESHSGGLVHELETVEAGDLRGVEHGASLRVRHVAGHGHDTVVHLGVEIHLGDALQLDQERGHHLLGGERARLAHVVRLEQDLFVGGAGVCDAQRLVASLDLHLRVIEFARDKSLEARDRVLAVGDLLLLGRVALETLVVCISHVCAKKTNKAKI